MEIHHIGYVVRDIDLAAKKAELLGYKREGAAVRDQDRNIRILFVIKDGVRLELIAPDGTPNPVDSILSKAGASPYHMAYLTDDMDADLSELKSNGWKMIQPPKSAAAFHDAKVVFLYHRDLGMIELIEKIPQARKTLYSQVIKRMMDIVFSLILLILLSPFFLLICLAELLFCGAPVFYRSERPGRDGRMFSIYKFRTMTPCQAENRDCNSEQSRITPLGHFLRRTSIDELPQLWNILRGDMSFIGPRPIPVRSVEMYSARHRQRLAVRPGFACFRISSKNENGSWTYREQFENDIVYIQSISLIYDLRMLGAILRHTFLDTYTRENALRPEFDGTNLDWTA